jgi:hypothetical protein
MPVSSLTLAKNVSDSAILAGALAAANETVNKIMTQAKTSAIVNTRCVFITVSSLLC